MTAKEWAHAKSPSIADIEALAAEAWDRLPQAFRRKCGNVVIQVEDFATDEVLDALEIESPFDLMGLYQGVSLDRKSIGDISHGPDLVYLYRRSILDYWSENDETLGHLVTHVLVHEIGHHFGLSDEAMAAIEAAAAAS